MAAVAPSSLPAFELKSAALTLVAVLLKTTDLAQLADAMTACFSDAPELFDREPVAVDLSSVRDVAEPIDFALLIALLRGHGLRPIAARGGSAAQMDAARAAGLTEAHGAAAAPRLDAAADAPIPAAASSVSGTPATPIPARTPDAPHDAPADPLPDPRTSSRTALIVDKPLRSGQRVYARGADLVVLAVVSHGAEVIADGNIHVYAPLRGRALAGALGDTAARIFTTCMEPQLLSIAGIYRTTETELAPDVLGQPAQVRLDGEKLIVEAMKY